jgi:hypothetical protein
MKAEIILRERWEKRDGSIIEMVIWRLDEPIKSCTHPFKYRLVYVKNGRRFIGFDNERGKGDHQHRRVLEFPYHFVSIDKLMDDFIREIERWRGER